MAISRERRLTHVHDYPKFSPARAPRRAGNILFSYLSFLLDRSKKRGYNTDMTIRKRFVIAVDGFCDENAEQLAADGVKIFPTRTFIGGVPVDPPTDNASRDRVLTAAKTGENSVIPSISAEYVRFFDSVLDENDGGDLIFLSSLGNRTPLSAASECMVKFYGSNVFVLPVRGLGAAIVPILESALSLQRDGETAQAAFSELSATAEKLVSISVCQNGDGFASYKIMRCTTSLGLDRLSRGNAQTAAFIASEVGKSATKCVYLSHAGNFELVRRIATAINESDPSIKIKVGCCSPATLALTSAGAVTVGFVKF